MMDHELDQLITQNLPELPPAAITSGVTPWRKAVNRVLIGMALTSLTLNSLCLNYILPFIGMVLLLLGFRALRRENGWFRLCWVTSILRLTGQMFLLMLNATIYHSLFPTAAMTALSAVSISLQLIQVASLWLGLRRVRSKAGLAAGSGSALGVLVWYLLIVALGLSGYNGLFLALALVLCYLLLLRCLYRLSAELDEAGYAITPAPVRIDNGWIMAGVTALLALGLLCCHLFLSRFPMEWTQVDITQSEQVEQIKADLLALDFPAAVLSDLTETDILACEGALWVEVETSDVTPQTNLDAAPSELRITTVCVELPSETSTCVVFHHFAWLTEPDFCGNDGIILTSTEYIGDWDVLVEPHGQLFCDQGDEVYTSPFARLEQETQIAQKGTYDRCYFQFSLPAAGEHFRGYLCYTVQLDFEYTTVLSSIFEYIHQLHDRTYPKVTDLETQSGYAWYNLHSTGPFSNDYGGISYYPTNYAANETQ